MAPTKFKHFQGNKIPIYKDSSDY